MGLDFIETCAPAFQRGWDRGKEELSEPDLWSKKPEMRARTFRAVRTDGGILQEGQEYLLHERCGQIIIVDAQAEIGHLVSPPPFVKASIAGNGSGLALGVIEKTYPISRAADVSIR